MGALIIRIVAGLSAASALFISAIPASAATRNATAQTLVRQTTGIIKSRDLAFGNVIRGTAAGTVTINAQTGVRTSTGGVLLIGTGFTSASFTGSGAGGVQVRISIAPTTITLTRSGGAQTMTINTLRVSAGGAAQQTMPRNFNLPATGVQTFNIGGRLNVAANQVAGNYAGTFTVTMNYQ